MVGKPLTVNENELVVNDSPSVTIILMMELPNWLVPGVMVRLRLAPLPPRTRFA